jgi:hypothetical protein
VLQLNPTFGSGPFLVKIGCQVVVDLPDVAGFIWLLNEFDTEFFNPVDPWPSDLFNRVRFSVVKSWSGVKTVDFVQFSFDDPDYVKVGHQLGFRIG